MGYQGLENSSVVAPLMLSRYQKKNIQIHKIEKKLMNFKNAQKIFAFRIINVNFFLLLLPKRKLLVSHILAFLGLKAYLKKSQPLGNENIS
jgi:hypothetical protein